MVECPKGLSLVVPGTMLHFVGNDVDAVWYGPMDGWTLKSTLESQLGKLVSAADRPTVA